MTFPRPPAENELRHCIGGDACKGPSFIGCGDQACGQTEETCDGEHCWQPCPHCRVENVLVLEGGKK